MAILPSFLGRKAILFLKQRDYCFCGEQFLSVVASLLPVPTLRLLKVGPMLLGDEIEIINEAIPRGRFRSVLFDFDGTLSLIREGWPQVMIPMMVEVLRATGTPEDDAALTAAVEEFVMRLNGRQTIYQMIQLAEEARKRGGVPLEPLDYKRR